jgi:hypothetical protein
MSPKKKVLIVISAVALITIILIGLVLFTKMKTAYYNPFNGNTILSNVYGPDKTRTSVPNQNLVLDRVILITPEEKGGRISK